MLVFEFASWHTNVRCRPRDAEKFLAKYQRLDLAVDKYYENPREFASGGSSKKNDQERISRLNELFDRYKGMCIDRNLHGNTFADCILLVALFLVSTMAMRISPHRPRLRGRPDNI